MGPGGEADRQDLQSVQLNAADVIRLTDDTEVRHPVEQHVEHDSQLRRRQCRAE